MRVILNVLAACAIWGLGPTVKSVPIGERSVDIIVADTGTEMTFIRLHQNESPAGAVGAKINTEVGSRFIDLSQQGTRHLATAAGGRGLSIDPNRIFSRGAAPEARALARALTRLLLPNAPVVALHNNRGTLLRSYTSGPLNAHTMAVYVNPSMDAATFVIVSTRLLFEAIKNLGITVVWENRAGANDDGSLLAYAQRHGIPYVNVEAALGTDPETQLHVVRRIVTMLRSSSYFK